MKGKCWRILWPATPGSRQRLNKQTKQNIIIIIIIVVINKIIRFQLSALNVVFVIPENPIISTMPVFTLGVIAHLLLDWSVESQSV